jgi:hypothetical protein
MGNDSVSEITKEAKAPVISPEANAPAGGSTERVTDKLRILSIDGGGVRGIIPATILEYLENELQVKSFWPRPSSSEIMQSGVHPPTLPSKITGHWYSVRIII